MPRDRQCLILEHRNLGSGSKLDRAAFLLSQHRGIVEAHRSAVPQSVAALLGACVSGSSSGFGVQTMPVDLPPGRKPAHAVAAPPTSLMGVRQP